MSANRIRILVTGAVVSGLVTTLTTAHEPIFPAPPIPVETVDSLLAYPTDIHLRVTDRGVVVKGKLKRKRYARQSLLGHIDVELLDSTGRVLEWVAKPIQYRLGSAKYDRKRYFSAVLPTPESNQYSVRVKHHIGMAAHESLK